MQVKRSWIVVEKVEVVRCTCCQKQEQIKEANFTAQVERFIEEHTACR